MIATDKSMRYRITARRPELFITESYRFADARSLVDWRNPG